jgi:hypothetical protein
MTRAARRTTPPRLGQPFRLSRLPLSRRHSRPDLCSTPRCALRVHLMVSFLSSLCRRSLFRRRTPSSRHCRRRASPTCWTLHSPIGTRPHAPRSSLSNGPLTPQPTTGNSFVATTSGLRTSCSAIQHPNVLWVRVPPRSSVGAPLVFVPAVEAVCRTNYRRSGVPAA